MQDAKNPHAALRTVVQDALVETGHADRVADVTAAVMRRLLAPEISWALAALSRDGSLRSVTIRQPIHHQPRPRVTRWFECPACLWAAVAESARCCENCGAKVEWVRPIVT